jgi:hypothetical protein
MILLTFTAIYLPSFWFNQILEDLRTQHSILVLDFIVHLSHYMFQPRLAAIFRWFVNTKNIFKVVSGCVMEFGGKHWDFQYPSGM